MFMARRPCTNLSAFPRKILPEMVRVLLMGAVLAVPAGGAMADEFWIGGGSDDWSDPGNWGSAVPGTADVVTIHDTMGNAMIGAGVNAQAGSLLVGQSLGYLKPPGWSPSGLFGDLNITGGGMLATNMAEIGYLADNVGFVYVAGGGTTWDNAANLVIGETATSSGTVSVGGGAAVTTGMAYLGYAPGSDGTLILSNGGSWNSGTFTVIGNNGDGVLSMSAGASLNSSDIQLGLGTTANGTALLTGTGTAMNVTDELVVGQSGGGSLSIENGADVTASNQLVAGWFNGSNGSVAVNGAGSTLTSPFVYVGASGTGALDVINGAAVNMAVLHVGSLGSGVGTVTIGGTGSTMSVSNSVNVGGAGFGTFNIVDGATFNSAAGTIATKSGSIGSVLIDGLNSGWTSTGALTVGAAGDGDIVIQKGFLVADSLVVSSLTGTGSVAVTNAGSSLEVTNSLSLGGFSSIGTLAVSAGGTAASASGSIGTGAAGTGIATITGNASTWTTTGNIAVGDAGTGALKVEDGAAVSAASLYIGSQSGAAGTVTVDAGASLAASANTFVGADGTGTLSVTSGGATTGNALAVGYGVGSSGTVRVDGTGSTSSFAGDLSIGGAGTGVLEVAHAGVVTGANAIVGGVSGGTGTAQVNGAGSLWTIADDVDVGKAGIGALTIGAGAVVSNNNGYIGHLAGGTGVVEVDGAGSSWTMTNDLLVGFSGTASLTITHGGVVTNAGVLNTVGSEAGSSGEALISGAGSIWQNTNGGLFIGTSGAGKVTIADGGTVSVGTGVGIAINAGSAGTLNVGAAEGDVAAAPGAVTATNMLFGSGAGQLVFNHTDTGYTFTPLLQSLGAVGEIKQLSGDTIYTGDGSLFFGTTTVSGGRLSVNGTLGGTFNITGGALGGSGTLGTVSATTGGTLAPGNSVGTLNVVNATINAGSIYEVELNDGGNVAGTNNDLLNATGTVTINGGTVNVMPENGTDDGTTYAPGLTYTIIAATGGVNGVFDALADNYAFLNFGLSYDANTVYLSSSLNDLCLPGFTANQCATADGVETLGASTLLTAVTLLANSEAASAMDGLSGEFHASAKTVLIEDSRFARDAALIRLRNALSATSVNANGMVETEASNGQTFWSQAFGAFGAVDSDGNTANMDRDIGGIFLGGDTAVAGDSRLGLMGGYSHTRFSVDGRSSSGVADTYTLGVYGGKAWDAFAVKVGLAHSWHSLDTSRTVAFAGFSDSLSASYEARTFQAHGEIAYGIDTVSARIEPFASFAHVRLTTDGFTESGGAAALSATGQTVDDAFSTIGVRAEKRADLGRADANLRGMVGWRHVFDGTPTAALAFASGSNGFTVAGGGIARDLLTLNIGVDLDIAKAAKLGLAYDGQFGTGLVDHGLKASLSVRF